MGDARQARVEAALEHAAEQLGDITPLVMAEFFHRFPAAEASFAHHAPHDPARLGAEMVDNALYCLMTWCERRSEVEIILQTSAPHHADTLHVPGEWYAGLLVVTANVLAGAARDAEEAGLWAQLADKLGAAVAASIA